MPGRIQPCKKSSDIYRVSNDIMLASMISPSAGAQNTDWLALNVGMVVLGELALALVQVAACRCLKMLSKLVPRRSRLRIMPALPLY